MLLFLLPGWGLQALVLQGRPGCDRATRLTIALLLPWSAYSVVGIVAGSLGAPPLFLVMVVPPLGIALLLWSVRGKVSAPRPRPDVETFWIVVLTLVVTLLVFAAPLQLDLKSDVFAHVSAIRASLEEARIFPVHEFYPPAQGTGADPRFSVFHALLAAWSFLARSTPLQVWHTWLLFAMASIVLSTGLLARAATRTRLGLVAAHLGFLGAFGGSFHHLFQAASYPLAIALSQLWMLFALFFSVPAGERARIRNLLIVAGILLGALGTHVLGYLLGMLMLLLACLADPGTSWRRTARPFVGVLLLTTPFALLRFLTSYGDVNPIHHRPFFLMEWAPGWTSASPAYLLAWLFPFGLLGLLLAVLQLRPLLREAIHRWALALSILGLGWVLLPFLLVPSMKMLGFLPMRLLHLVLFPVFLGFAVDSGLAPGRRQGIRLAAGLLVLLLLGATGARIQRLYRATSTPLVTTAAWRDLARFAGEHFDAQTVVLSDPFSMIALRATAPVSVVAVPDGRSSPRDAHSIDRLRDAWKAMSPHMGAAVTDDILDRYGITHVLVDHLFRKNLSSYEYPLLTRDFPAQSRKFRGNPRRFREVWASGDLVLYQVEKDETLSWEGYRQPCLRPRAPEEAADSTIALSPSFALRAPRVVLHDEGLPRRLEIDTAVLWNSSTSPPDRHFIVRADRLPGPVPSSLGLVAKPVRKLVELSSGTRYRYRWTLLPPCPLFLLDTSTRLPVSFELPLPADMPSGHYRVTLQIADLSEFTVLRPRDFLQDDDVFTGAVIGEFALE